MRTAGTISAGRGHGLCPGGGRAGATPAGASRLPSRPGPQWEGGMGFESRQLPSPTIRPFPLKAAAPPGAPAGALPEGPEGNMPAVCPSACGPVPTTRRAPQNTHPAHPGAWPRPTGRQGQVWPLGRSWPPDLYSWDQADGTAKSGGGSGAPSREHQHTRGPSPFVPQFPPLGHGHRKVPAPFPASGAQVPPRPGPPPPPIRASQGHPCRHSPGPVTCRQRLARKHQT